MHQIVDPQSLQLQHHAAQIAAQNLGICLIDQIFVKSLLSVQTKTLRKKK
jgi:hypothetical protein